MPKAGCAWVFDRHSPLGQKSYGWQADCAVRRGSNKHLGFSSNLLEFGPPEPSALASGAVTSFKAAVAV